MPRQKLDNKILEIPKKVKTNYEIKKQEKKVQFDDVDMDGGEYEEDIIEQTDFGSVEEKGDGDIADPNKEVNEDVDKNAIPDEIEDSIKENDEDEDKLDEIEEYEEEGEREGEEKEVEYDRDESCLYNFTKKQNDEDDENDEDELHFEDDDEVQNVIVDDPTTRESKPVLTKYERVRILGIRARQLSLGAKPMLLNIDNLHPKEIAKLELELGKLPFKIEREFPNGRKEIWKVSELKIVN